MRKALMLGVSVACAIGRITHAAPVSVIDPHGNVAVSIPANDSPGLYPGERLGSGDTEVSINGSTDVVTLRRKS